MIYTVKGFSEVSEAEKWKWKLLSCVLLFATPWTVAHQAPLSLGFSRQEILEQGAITYSMGSSWPGDQTDISCVSWSGRQILYHCATWAAFCYLYVKKKGWRGPEGEEGHSLQLWYLRLLIFLLTILIPACASSSPALCKMYSAYKLNKQGDIHSLDELLSQFGTSLLFMSSFNCCFLTCI